MGVRRFFLAGDFNLELGMLKEGESMDFYGPFCWVSPKADLASEEEKKLMWMDMMEEFGCSVASTWLRCHSRLEGAYTWEGLGDREVRKQLDHVGAPKCTRWEDAARMGSPP